ncbi:MAG: CvpA family protein [Firmicutes bacterium]|nr:CvpA family protein [Bacillota bacterium]
MDSFSATWNWLDWLIAGLLVLGGVQGFRRGLVGMVAGLAGYMAGLFVAGRYAGAVLQWADGRFGLVDRVADLLHRRIRLPGGMDGMPLAAVPPDLLRTAVEALPLPTVYHRSLLARLQEMAAAQTQVTLGEAVVALLAQGILKAMAFAVVLSVVTWAVAWGVQRISDLADRLPVVGTANRGLGALVGLLEVLLVLTLAAALLTPILSLPVFRSLTQGIAGSRLVPWLLELYGWLAAVIFGGAEGYFLPG